MSLSAPIVEKTNLRSLLKPFIGNEKLITIPEDAYITGINVDSREIGSGDLFIACPGYQTDARQYIESVFEKGANWVVAEQQNLEKFVKGNSKVIGIENLADKVSALSARYFQNPTAKQNVIGFTGTNGKTSCCYLLSQALDLLQHKALMLSTLGNGDFAALESSANTTPDAFTIQKIAHEYLERKYHYISMEVSSHGLSLNRVAAVNYNTAVFSNLSHDHLDFHGNMENYFQAKRKLFVGKDLKTAVINIDDEYGLRLFSDKTIKAKKVAFSLLNKEQIIARGLNPKELVYCENQKFSLNGISCDLYTPWGQAKLHSPLLGGFNLANLLAVAATLGSSFGDTSKWIIALNNAQAVPGRMHSFISTACANVVVDYAHTPDALKKALQAARQHCDGDIWCLFGCGGDRDNSKRAVMGEVAEQYSEHPIIIDDNPRTETPAAIVEMIRRNLQDQKMPYIADRNEAIAYALDNADKNDLILVAGKGHEDYQEIGKVKKSYSDLETVAQLLEARK